MNHSVLVTVTRTPRAPGLSCQTVLVVRKHHPLVRWSHWLNLPILVGLILSGISIYWASPIYQHRADPKSGNFDVAADIGVWICAHVPGQHDYASPPDWIYNHMSLGPAGMLAIALRLHWLCAYLFMLNGMAYVAGPVAGEGWRSLMPRRTDLADGLRMFRYYLGFPVATTEFESPLRERSTIPTIPAEIRTTQWAECSLLRVVSRATMIALSTTGSTEQ